MPLSWNISHASPSAGSLDNPAGLRLTTPTRTRVGFGTTDGTSSATRLHGTRWPPEFAAATVARAQAEVVDGLYGKYEARSAVGARARRVGADPMMDRRLLVRDSTCIVPESPAPRAHFLASKWSRTTMYRL